jgi:hypothetical protein
MSRLFSLPFRRIRLLIAAAILVSVSASAQEFSFHALHNFVGSDGAFPFGNLISDSAGNIYGVAADWCSSSSPKKGRAHKSCLNRQGHTLDHSCALVLAELRQEKRNRMRGERVQHFLEEEAGLGFADVAGAHGQQEA